MYIVQKVRSLVKRIIFAYLAERGEKVFEMIGEDRYCNYTVNAGKESSEPVGLTMKRKH